MSDATPAAISALRRRLHRGLARVRATNGHAPAPVVPAPAPGDPLAAVLERDGLDMANMRRLIAFGLRPDSCCVDVGAHRGAILGEIVRVSPHGRHVAYEPIPALAAGLRRTFPGVDVREAALSNHSGSSTFEHVRGTAEGCSGFVVCTAPPDYLDDVEQIEVRLERLDDTFSADAPLALIKIDVEGAEQQVLEGAIATLGRTRPTILFEHTFAASNAYGTQPADVFDLLREEIGLRVFDINGNGPFTTAEFDELSRRGDPINFVAHP
jgi:FkbM family methyltransferase